ncbi:ABC transporter permease [Aquabacter spiritensis]|uniref:Putative spermidine/putrescine transport system permease protein n=1 Tax=Aquabacter spiritensis TaxID=933073 RepID=A0A4R3LPC7_9HYPH|nr:ABC transporter permease [Aquabacter spiritensis]TCT02240.1 putative spermidine/putrescine transport system permease protein [Aquabacter spiritensis]
MILGRALWRLWIFLIFAFLPAPILVVIVSSFSRSGYLRFPPTEFSLRWYGEFLSSPIWLKALGTSTVLAVGVALATTAVAFLAAFATSRLRFPGKGSLELLLLSPLLFPHAAIGVALLGVVAALGWIGTFQAVALAHVILCIPFAYRPILNSMRKMDLALEEAAMSLGAEPAYVFRHVTLPLLRPGLVTALLFSFIISFDEVTVTLFLIGPSVSTLPTQVFAHILESADPVIAAISSFLVLVTVVLVALLDRFVGLELFVEAERSR